MRSLVPTGAALAASLLLAACGGGSDTTDAPYDPARGVYTVTLRTGQPVAISQESLTLRLTEVRDTRCPIDAICVWAGQAVVAVQVQQAGQAAETLQIGMPAPAEMKLPGDGSYRGYRLSLQALDPAPRAAVNVPQDQYRATLLVGKAAQ